MGTEICSHIEQFDRDHIACQTSAISAARVVNASGETDLHDSGSGEDRAASPEPNKLTQNIRKPLPVDLSPAVARHLSALA